MKDADPTDRAAVTRGTDLHDSGSRGQQMPPPCRARVAEHRAGPRINESGGEACLIAKSAVTEGVDARMDPTQAAVGKPAIDRIAAQPATQELPAAHHPPLPVCQPSDAN
jgi:hypothetical protein